LACQWRIRHKLMLGLGLVVGVVGVLLAGALMGLASYQTTVKMFDSKLQELDAVRRLKEDLVLIPDLQPPANITVVKEQVTASRGRLATFVVKLEDTVNRGRDPENGIHERHLIGAMEKHFADLDEAIEQLDNRKKNKAIEDLVRSSDELYITINEGLGKRMEKAKIDFKTSLVIVLSISCVGILLMTGLLRFFYRWTFHPVRDLQAGVGRVAQGDFEHPIVVHSGDEMEELAGAFNDMTRRLREIYSDLARQVNERSRQLVRSERLAGVGFLAAGVAHEINNPLASIAFCSEALEARLNDCRLQLAEGRSSNARANAQSTISQLQADWEVIAKYLKMIQEEAFRCKAITQKLLEFSRGGERRREPTDLAELIQSVLDMVQHLPSSKGKKINFGGTEIGPVLWAPSEVGVQRGGRLVAWVNAQEIRSVVLNLVVNALDSLDDGGTLTIALRQRDAMAEMVFADTGCGMTPEVLENIFEPFFTRSRTGKGTGLGLSISHRIITQHGGDIEAASQGLNQGSTFTVRIPLQPAESAAEEPPARAAA
jgi:signal transduction histidine kinase